MVRYLVEQTVRFPLTVDQYTRTKFKAMVSPNEELLVIIHLHISEKTVTGKFKITKEENRPVAGGNFVLKSNLQNC